MTDDDREWLHHLADALEKAQRHPESSGEGAPMLTITLSDELARGVADRLRDIAETYE